MFVYIVRNKINGKRYVGKTLIGVEYRWKKHLVDTFNEKLYAYNSYFHRAIRKYGVENFEFEEIFSSFESPEPMTVFDLSDWEKYFIQKYRTFIGFEDCNGYNMTLGGEGWTGRGKAVDVYDKDLNFIATYESIEETARKLKLYPTNVSAVINGRAKATGGYVFCESGLEPIQFVNITETKIDVYSLDGEFIKTFNTMRDAATFIDTNPTNVFDCCNQKQLRCKNYITVYHGDKLEDRRSDQSRNKIIDVYDVKTKQFVKTFNSMIKLKDELKISSIGVIQRCLRTDNHLAGEYLIVPHGIAVE